MALPSQTSARDHAKPTTDGAWLAVVAAGVAAAMHIWKLPAALADIQTDLGTSLVQAGLLLGIIQLASVVGGLATALWGELAGLRRLLIAGLVLLSIASALGALAPGTEWLIAARTVEGIGFLLAVVVAPALIRKVSPPRRLNVALASWASFQGTATLLGLSVGALFLQAASWREWWVVMAILTLLPVPLLVIRVPRDVAPADAGLRNALSRVGRTVATRRPWIIGVVFACYTAQWMAVLGFLPSIYRSAGLGGPWPGILSAVVGGVNAIGALSAGPLIKRGLTERRIIFWTFLAMSFASVATFSVDWTIIRNGILFQVVLIAVFSAVGGLIPAAVTSYSVRIAPADGSVTAVLGLTQQIFNVGNFLGPTLFALLATTTGGWGTTWWLTCGMSAAGMALLVFLGQPKSGTGGTSRGSRRGFPPNGKLECKAGHTSLESRKRR
ncbi:CynX/NimT family MFS transporter [Paenarthrobacter ureafaciens]|uniref:MFS transporter n=1 Tax=Paenarthrobacter ureafaciens TaxID=37931 RepID=UPI001FB45E38|nr:MFS transporter [Paenarthrobacter ureafaciens]UOD81206.1 MFS transporter [Paenarthrobacter ureafaciens]WNZ03856.1 MFS transporter [Paenarthrobacter ureafaciens]